jgi:predicted transcriptional regulator
MTPKTEAKLNELAQRTHRSKEELLEEAVNCLVAYNEWFHRKIKNSLAAAERGETVPDECVRAWMEQQQRSGETSNPDEDFRPVEISGEPLSETILRERR